MHYCLLVFHKEGQDVIDMVMKYCDGCDSMIGSFTLNKEVEEGSELFERIKDRIIDAFTPLYEPLRVYVDLDYNDILLVYALGECDWFVIGGRWEGFLTDKNDGSKHDTLKVSDVDMNNLQLLQIQYQGNYMLPDGVWRKLSETPDKTIEKLFEDAVKDDLYVTVVDCHN